MVLSARPRNSGPGNSPTGQPYSASACPNSPGASLPMIIPATDLIEGTPFLDDFASWDDRGPVGIQW